MRRTRNSERSGVTVTGVTQGLRGYGDSLPNPQTATLPLTNPEFGDRKRMAPHRARLAVARHACAIRIQSPNPRAAHLRFLWRQSASPRTALVRRAASGRPGRGADESRSGCNKRPTLRGGVKKVKKPAKSWLICAKSCFFRAFSFNSGSFSMPQPSGCRPRPGRAKPFSLARQPPARARKSFHFNEKAEKAPRVARRSFHVKQNKNTFPSEKPFSLYDFHFFKCWNPAPQLPAIPPAPVRASACRPPPRPRRPLTGRRRSSW